MFYVAPLFLIALLVWIERGLPRPRVATAAAAAIAGAAARASFPYGRLSTTGAISDTLALLPLVAAASGTVLARSTRWRVAARGRRRVRALFWLVPAGYALVAAGSSSSALRRGCSRPVGTGRTASSRRRSGRSSRASAVPQRDWIDRARRAATRDVAVALDAAHADRFTINENEFFNRSVGPRLRPRRAAPGGAGRDTGARSDRETASS